MQIYDIVMELRSNIDHIMKTEDRDNVYGAAFLIDKLNIFLRNYIFYFNQQNLGHPEVQFTQQQVAYLDSILAELSNNFFPMAHTSVSLGALQITDREKMSLELQSVRYLHQKIEYLMQEINQELKNCKEAERRLNSLANP
jgi:hypothetical protein